MNALNSKNIEILELGLLSAKTAKDIHAFHLKNISKHLYLREEDFFTSIKGNEVFSLTKKSNNQIIGICYVKDDSEGCGTVRHEFGGVCIDQSYKGIGLAEIFCKLSLIHRFSFREPIGRVVSHIHENNSLPTKLFERQLHFDHVGFEIMPSGIAFASKMELNPKGLLVGELYNLSMAKIAELENWLQQFKANDFVLKTKSVDYKIVSALLSFEFVEDTIENLNSFSSKAAINHFCIGCIVEQFKSHLVRYY